LLFTIAFLILLNDAFCLESQCSSDILTLFLDFITKLQFNGFFIHHCSITKHLNEIFSPIYQTSQLYIRFAD